MPIEKPEYKQSKINLKKNELFPLLGIAVNIILFDNRIQVSEKVKE